MHLASHELEPRSIPDDVSLLQKVGNLAFGSAAALAATLVLAPTALAGSIIGDTSEKPYKGRGAWGTTAVSGLVFTRAIKRDAFDRALKSDGEEHSWGLLTDRVTGIGQCAWVENEYIDGLKSDPLDSENPCIPYLKIKDDPDTFAKDINQCKDGIGLRCVDGVKTPIRGTCTNKNAYYKFAPAKRGFDNVDFPEHGSGPIRYAGKVEEYVYSRWTRTAKAENGRSWRMVRTEKMGWVWIRDMCTYNDEDGGTPKTEDTVPGPNPNAGKSVNETNALDASILTSVD